MMRLLRRLSYLLHKRRRERDLAEEIAFHRDLAGDPKIFGNGALASNQSRDVWIWPWLQDAAHDFRVSARLLMRERSFTLVAAGVLAVGIGVDNTLLIAVNAACLRGLPIARADRVLSVTARDARRSEVALSYREFAAIQDAAPAFGAVAAHAGFSASVGDDHRAPDRAVGTFISRGAFQLLGESPLLGRDFSADDDRPGAPPVAILGGGLWKSRYGADPTIIGRSIRVNGIPTTVVGVIRPGFKFPRFTEIWLPLHHMPGLGSEQRARVFSIFGRLRADSASGDAHGQLASVADRLAHDYPETNEHVAIDAEPINNRYNQRLTDPSWIGFMIVGAIVLLIACANVANLMLMRAAQRAQEFAIRASLGASRARLVRQLLIESSALAALGGIAGAALAIAGGKLLTMLVPENSMPFWIRFTMDGRMLAILSAVTLATVFVFGIAPAAHVAKTDVHDALKNGGRGSVGSRRTSGWTTVLLAGEFALTVMLVTMLVKGERLARAGERLTTPIDATNVVSGSIVLPGDRYRGPGDRLRFFDDVEARLGAMPSIEAVAFATALPATGAVDRTLEIDGQPSVEAGKAPTVWMLAVGPRYFDALGVNLLRGRAFTTTDGSSGAGAAIVNQRFVDLFFNDRDPLGNRVRLAAPTPLPAAQPWLTIVAVAPTLRQRLSPDPDPLVYVPIRGEPPAAAAAIVRGSRDTQLTTGALRDAVRDINPDLPIARLMPLEQAIGEAQWAMRGSTRISESVVLIAMLLAAVGLYAVTAHAVVLRRGEISVRRALGARAGHIVWMVWRRASMQIAIGGTIGVAGGIAWQRVTGSWFSTTGTVARLLDPIDFILVVGVVATIGLIACLVPAWRAVRMDPLPALRNQ